MRFTLAYLQSKTRTEKEDDFCGGLYSSRTGDDRVTAHGTPKQPVSIW